MTQKNIKVNKPEQLNTINTANPNLVKFIQPSVRKRGGPLQGRIPHKPGVGRPAKLHTINSVT